MKSLLKKIIPRTLINFFWHKPLAIAACVRYGFPAKKMIIVGIAGTKGKTSTAYAISHILDEAKKPNALICTAAIKINGQESPNTVKMTSPNPWFLNRFLSEAYEKGCRYAIIEVSSHAIDQHRVLSIPFAVVVLTNLYPDHLEYHKDALEYQQIHRRIVSGETTLILNAEDTVTRKFRATPKQKIYVTQEGPLAKTLNETEIPLMAGVQRFNLYAAAATALFLGCAPETISHALQSLTAIPGRFEHIKEGQPFDVIVDYAHSPVSLTAFFQSLAVDSHKPVIAVFGACGERDPHTRAEMGSILDQFADIIIVTNDDPYGEDPNKIAAELIGGIPHKTEGGNLYTILDRKEAIAKALSLASPYATVCILGKGAEQFQVFNHTKIPWDDRQVVRELLRLTNYRAQTQGQ
ncbi:hypothetical protein HY622_03555 [Candidatus Uhrbacteria bacterium]|nr:hypothetical protein [Candidatus Uhrbacteria bacterium]